MKHDTQVELGKALLRHIEARTTDMAPAVTRNPVTRFTDPGILRRERELLFRRRPLLMGFSCQVPNAGDYLTDDFSGVPILVVRNEEGSLSAMLNVCRHRGSRVAREACGNVSRRLVCPYHAWSYDLRGRLAGVPHDESFPEVDAAGHSLRPLPVAEKYGMIWVCPTPGAALDIDVHLAGLGPELASYGFERYHFYETRTIARRMNWKMAIDTFLETYHFAALHRETVGPIFFPNVMLFHPFGPNLRETVPRRTILELRDEPEAAWDILPHTAIVYILFPNTVFIIQGDHVETWRVYPVADRPDRCVMYLDFLTPQPATTDGARRYWDRNMDLAVATVDQEDFPVNEDIQRGYLSGAQDHVTWGRNEPALAHFEQSVAAALEET